MSPDEEKLTPYRPNETQRVRVELTRVESTDHHRVNELMMHMIENCEHGIEENRSNLTYESERRRAELAAHAATAPHISQDAVKNWIAGALLAERQSSDKRARAHYFKIFIRWVLPSAGGAGFVSELGHFIARHF